MNAMTNGKAPNRTRMARMFSVLFDEAVWQFVLLAVVVTVIVDGAFSLGGGTIA